MAFSTTRKEDLSLKLRTQNMKNTKHITKQLEMESQKMEDRLNELRLAMNREKEERETQGGGFWGSGQTGSLNTYAKDVLNNKTAGTNKANREKAANKKNKVKVLKDEPIVVPERKKVIGNMANIAQRDPDAKVKGPKCGQCETKGAHVSCRECGEDYCASCFAAFHMKGALKKHRSAPLGSGNVRRTFSPMPTPRNNNTVMVNTGRVDSPASQSSSSHSANSVGSDRQISVYHNGELKAAQENSLLDGEYNEEANADDFRKALEEWRQNNKKPTEKLVAPDETALRRRRPSDIAREQILNNYQGPSLWEGNYSETESAASFQDALKDWRSGGTPADANTKLQSASKTQVANTDSSTSTMNPKEPELNIHFTQSLTYAEKLLLKKHRRTELDAIPDSRVSSSYSGTSPNSRTATSTDFDDEPYSSRLGFSDGLSSTRPTSSASTYVGPTSAMSSDSRTESRLTITDIDESKMSRRALRGIEQTSSYQVQESPSVTAHRQTPDSQNQEKSPPSRLSHSPVTRNSPSPAPPSKKPATPTARRPHRNIRSPAKIERTAVEEIEPRSLLSRPSSSASDIVSSLATKREEEFHVAPRNNRYRDLFQTKQSDELDWDKACKDKANGASKPLSARSKSKVGGTPRGNSSRASSRASTRATSRAASRAYSRISMFGDGVLTKKPSDALNHVARLADLLPRPQPVDDAMGLSDFFMAGVKKPFEERVVTPRISSARKTPRPVSGRSSQQTMEKWKVSNKTYQMAPRSWRPDSSLGDVIPDHEVAAVLDTAAQDFSAFNTTATETDPELERESTLTFSLSRQNTENLNPTASHGLPMNSAAQTQTSQKSRPPSVTKRTSAMTPRIKTPLLDPLRSQTPRTRPGTPRSRAPTPRMTTPLVAAAEAIPERPSSRAIVPDGDDLSRFDEAGEVEEREKDDDHTLDALEWELASQEGRITADGKISRMSMMEDDILEDQEEMEEEKNWDVGKHLRESVLMDDFDDMEDQMMQEEEVKALH